MKINFIDLQKQNQNILVNDNKMLNTVYTTYCNALETYIFEKPVNISKFRIKFFDKFGKKINFGGSNYSLTLELETIIPKIDLIKEYNITKTLQLNL